jgi:hypothetical protein
MKKILILGVTVHHLPLLDHLAREDEAQLWMMILMTHLVVDQNGLTHDVDYLELLMH